MSDVVGSHSRSIPVNGAAAIDLRMRDGSARIIPGAGDSITAEVSFSAHPDRDYRGQCTKKVIDAANVAMRRVALTIDIAIEPRGLRCSEHWTVTVPRGISVVASGDVANLSVAGITGDVIATVDVGNVSIRDAGASAVARVRSVGNASVESNTTNYSEAVAESDVGKTELRVDGHRLDVRRAPGPGGRIALKGSGKDRIVAETGVGDARVSLIRNSTPNASN